MGNDSGDSAQGLTLQTREPVVIFDGDCGLCHACVRFILRHEREPGRLLFAARDSDFARRALGDAARPDSLALVVPGDGGVPNLLFRTDALIAIGPYLRAPWDSLAALKVIPRPARDAAYSLVACVRRKISARPESACPAGDARSRARFLS